MHISDWSSDVCSSDLSAMGHGAMAGDQSMTGMDMGSMNMREFSKAPQVKRGPGVQTISPMPMDRTGEPGQGLEDVSQDRKSTRLNSSHECENRMPSSA